MASLTLYDFPVLTGWDRDPAGIRPEHLDECPGEALWAAECPVPPSRLRADDACRPAGFPSGAARWRATLDLDNTTRRPREWVEVIAGIGNLGCDQAAGP